MEETTTLAADQGMLEVLDSSGDTKLMWNRNNREEVKAAKDMFESLKAKRFLAFQAEGEDGRKGKQISEFNPRCGAEVRRGGGRQHALERGPDRSGAPRQASGDAGKSIHSLWWGMICYLCKADLDPGEFFIDNRRPRGRHRWCKSCHSKQQKIRRMSSPARRYSELKGNAIKRHIAWNLSFEDFVIWLWGAECYFCGKPANGGVDRMNNEAHYDAYNTLACCKTCNSMKGKQTLHEFLTRLQMITGRLGIACGGE